MDECFFSNIDVFFILYQYLDIYSLKVSIADLAEWDKFSISAPLLL